METGNKASITTGQQQQRDALSLFASLLELQHFSYLQHLLVGQDRSSSINCLALRLCLCATSLVNECDGK